MSQFTDKSVQGEAVVLVRDDEDQSLIGVITRRDEEEWHFTPSCIYLTRHDLESVLWFINNCDDMYEFEFFDILSGTPTEEWKTTIREFLNGSTDKG